MATSGDMIVKVNASEILKLEKDGEGIIFEPKAEDAIVRLLEIQKEVDGAVEYLKSEIERQALEFNPNFTGLKGSRIKINYSASGAKYRDTGEIKFHREKFWTKKTVWSLDSKAIEEYKAKNYKLPRGVAEIRRKKTVRISEVKMASDGYGPIRVSYSILSSWARGDIDRAVAPYAGVEIEATEAMEYGKKKHEAWEKEARRTGRLPARFGGRKLKSPQLELNTKKVRKLNDWCYLSGVLDVLDGDTAIDYKTGRMPASEYLNSKQHECYQILYPNLKRFEYHCCNQHLQRKDDGYITVAIAYLDKNTLKDGIEWVLTMAAELREYLINNGMGDKLDQGKGLE